MALAYRRKLERLIVTCLSRLERFFKVDVPERARLGTRTRNFDSDQGIAFAIVSWIFHLFPYRISSWRQTQTRSCAELVLSACPTVVNPWQMFHPAVPCRESRKRPLSPTFMVRLGILYRTHVEQSHDELCAKQRAITTQTRFIRAYDT
ncbi:hypothetical protein EAG_12329 [Camponotus floridanus]|uniref:Uncharacterized protein n=1 Tax=Camponotus floridanus TaxID=104421 RepID=E2B0D4_CAMFO|nr:hypothetical protein EAG_12329 [Camponotus floridanus]